MSGLCLGHLTDTSLAEAVVANSANVADSRLRAVIEVFVRKLHEAVKEIESTEQAWTRAIPVPSETGRNCTDWRQEWILLSDLLGISMLVDAINHRKPSGVSEPTALGRFLVTRARSGRWARTTAFTLSTNRCASRAAFPCGWQRSRRARIGVWQAKEEGFHDVQQQGIETNFNLGCVFAQAGLALLERGAKAKFHSIANDGPVGSDA